ncbi:hypothetical protein ACTQ6A_10240 [Lachnospiraceae bacterium LCP25S3_G4]
MDYKMPYYMAYPMPLQYDDERLERRDYEYMKSMYPDMAKKILPYVEDECERLEYDNSMIFDEYPDKLMLKMLCRRIYRKVIEKDVMELETIMESQSSCSNGQCNWLNELIEVLVYQELCKRRCNRRRGRRRYY